MRPTCQLCVPLALSFAVGCGEASAPQTVTPSAPDRAVAAGAPPTVGDGRLSLDEARQYLVDLINRDRASGGLRPVTLDPGPATAAAQRHADDMAAHGYLGHWGTDGSVPESRYTAAGGTGMDLENALCFTDEVARPLDKNARIDPRELDKAEAMFFHEVPPNDGHRKNILRPWHVHAGIGIAQPAPTPGEIAGPCIAEELVADYGSYGPLPPQAKVGATVHVEGEVRGAPTFAGVGLARTDVPAPLSVPAANARRSYPVPSPYATYWPHGFRTPKEVVVKNGHFTIDLPLSDQGLPGLYEVSIWARFPETHDLQIISLRTIEVTR
jgi:uncharacterized protein YkwD